VTTPVAIMARKMASIAALHIRAGALERLSVTGNCHGRVGDEFIVHHKATTAFCLVAHTRMLFRRPTVATYFPEAAMLSP
jgi:hypothetical protein